MQQLQAIWQQIEAYLSDNISLIPVRDKDQILPSGTTLKAKTPCGNKAQGTTWQQYQKRIITKEELWHKMEQYNTTAVAMVGGIISGNLEIIDIDVKFNPGIDAILFSDIARFYPDLFARLRIHRTPSGGYHLLYRVSGGVVPGNLKLAGRIKTEEEKQADIASGIKKPQDTVNFLETRGEGGYALLPPSMGYTLHAGASIPVITWEERCSLISLCQSYTQVVKVEKAPLAPKQDTGYYSTNPFEDFNLSAAAEDVLINDGWAKFNENSTYIYFTRAGRSSVISASFHKERRIFYIWTTSSDVQNQKWYNPSTLLAQLRFNGDKSKLHHYLVSQGYGKLSNNAESRLITKLATTNKPLPANASKQAATALQEARTAAQEQYPHGIFWKMGDEGEITISRERLYAVSEGMGYRLHLEELVKIDGYKIHKCTPRQYFDTLQAYITEEDADIYEAIINSYEAFIEKHGKFTISRFETLDTSKILQSKKNISYKFYNNCYVDINPNGVEIKQYEDLELLVWADRIQNREFHFYEDYKDTLYYKFLSLAIGVTPQLLQIIGYYSHEYKDEESGYFAILSEKCENPKDGGGSGKNIFASLFQYTTTFKNIPGTQVQYNEKFMQSWNGQKIFSVSDVPKNFDYSFFKELSTGSGIVKHLYSNERSLDTSDMPKLMFSTNFSYSVADGGVRRRAKGIEFTDFFTKSNGVNAYFNAMFPLDWTENDWLGFDNIISMSIQMFLKNKNKIDETIMSATGWAKQFEQQFGSLTKTFIEQYIEDWCQISFVRNDTFASLYNEFCKENGINIKFHLSSQLMNRAIEDYCLHNGIHFEFNVKVKENNVSVRGRKFGTNTIPSEEKLPF
jgi:hypothetical protein